MPKLAHEPDGFKSCTESTCLVPRSNVASLLGEYGALGLAILDEWQPLTCAGQYVDPESLAVTDVDDVVYVSDRWTYDSLRRRSEWSGLEWWRFKYAMSRLRRAGLIVSNTPQVWHRTERGWRRQGVTRPDPDDPSRLIDVYERRIAIREGWHLRLTSMQMRTISQVSRHGGERAGAGRPRLECDGCGEKPGDLRKVAVDGEQMRLCSGCRDVARAMQLEFRARGNHGRSPPPAEFKLPLEKSFSAHMPSPTEKTSSSPTSKAAPLRGAPEVREEKRRGEVEPVQTSTCAQGDSQNSEDSKDSTAPPPDRDALALRLLSAIDHGAYLHLFDTPDGFEFSALMQDFRRAHLITPPGDALTLDGSLALEELELRQFERRVAR